MRFLSIWLTIFSIYNLYNNIGDQKANTAIFLVSLSLTFTIMMAEFWYKPRNQKGTTKMLFTVTIKNKLTNTEHKFDEWFGIEECFDRSKKTFDLIVEVLQIKDPDSYESVEELIEYFDIDLD